MEQEGVKGTCGRQGGQLGGCLVDQGSGRVARTGAWVVELAGSGCIWARLRQSGRALADGLSVQGKRNLVSLTPAVLTKDFEVDGRILLPSLVLGDAHILSLVILVHLPDGQLRAVVAEEVLLVLLILHLFPVSAGHTKGK